MFLVLRALVIAIFFYFMYLLYVWLNEKYSTEITCPQCDGEGVWETLREKETCLLCKGSGKIEEEV